MAEVTGGKRMKAALDELSKRLGRGGSLKVGYLENATYPDGMSVAQVALIQEYGAPAAAIPPRPSFRNMVAQYSPGWGRAIAAALVRNKFDVELTLQQTGLALRGQLQQSIIDTNAPALSPITVMLRKMKRQDPDLRVTGATVGEAARRVAAGESTAGTSIKPLVATGHMLNSVDYVVDKEPL